MSLFRHPKPEMDGLLELEEAYGEWDWGHNGHARRSVSSRAIIRGGDGVEERCRSRAEVQRALAER